MGSCTQRSAPAPHGVVRALPSPTGASHNHPGSSPPMPRKASWRELVIGLVSFAVLVGVGFSVLVFARVGRLHGSTFRLYALTGEARGVIRGSEVWLGGQ